MTLLGYTESAIGQVTHQKPFCVHQVSNLAAVKRVHRELEPTRDRSRLHFSSLSLSSVNEMSREDGIT